ncbi:MAG TPA: hypothetical protein VN914_06130, partial [Polyangia bacterium]|nr:hypothetical protein [Polyangia bacterium]
MASTTEVSADWIVRALVSGRMAEKLEAQRLLESSRVKIDGDAVRRRLIELLEGDYAPDADDAGEDAAPVRCWLLGALGRVPDAAREVEALLLKHTDRGYEPGPWARYW